MAEKGLELVAADLYASSAKAAKQIVGENGETRMILVWWSRVQPAASIKMYLDRNVVGRAASLKGKDLEKSR